MRIRNRPHSSLISAALLLGSVVFSLGLLELGLHVAHYGEANRLSIRELMEYDPLLGWRHKPNSSGEVSKDEYHVTVTYDSNGLRGSDPAYSKPQGASRIVVLGDSFVDGYTVQTQDRLTEVLAASLGPRFEVINLGVTGYSTDQELLLLEQEGWKYQPDLVVLAFYYNDVWGNGSRYFASDSSVQKPVFVADARGNLKLTNVPVPKPAPGWRQRSRIYRLLRAAIRGNHFLYSLGIKVGLAGSDLPSGLYPAPAGAAGGKDEFKVYRKAETPEIEREWTITQALLSRMKQETFERGVRFVVFYVPTRIELSSQEWADARLPPDYDPGEVVRRFVGVCKAEGIPYIEPSYRFKEAAKRGPLYDLHDPHWNTAGHHLVAKILAECIGSAWRGAACTELLAPNPF